MDFDLMRFYQTYVKYAILVNERRDAFSIAKVMYMYTGPDACLLFNYWHFLHAVPIQKTHRGP